jgi:hypothetical protein
MLFFLLIHADEAHHADLPPAEDFEVIARYVRLREEMVAAGVHVSGHRLRPVSTATTMRVREGRTLLTDGPFAETKEQFGGYYLIDVVSLDEALDWARKIPAAEYGSIEVRPVWFHPEHGEPEA